MIPFLEFTDMIEFHVYGVLVFWLLPIFGCLLIYFSVFLIDLFLNYKEFKQWKNEK